MPHGEKRSYATPRSRWKPPCSGTTNHGSMLFLQMRAYCGGDDPDLHENGVGAEFNG
jgi:hypothetical protein